jgi:hypothetical protein
MPNYNTSSPNPTTKNTINSVTIDYGIRDYLLNLNLSPQYPWISTAVNGSPRIGEPVLDTINGSGTVVVPIGLPLETNGITFKQQNVSNNRFINDALTSDSLTQIENQIPTPYGAFGDSYWPLNSESYPTSATDSVEEHGIKAKTNTAQFRKKNTIKNLYLDVSRQIDMADFITLTTSDITQQTNGYLDTYGNLNLGGSGTIQAINVLGSVLNGQGVGISKSGPVTNFDIRSSLAGRVLGASGLINDTKLGTIGGQQLVLALANNAAFNVQQELLGTLNVKDNVLSLIKGNGLAGFRPSYKITIPETTTGRVLDTAGKILGFTIPRSYLDDKGSIFQSESGEVENIDRANSMIDNTGKGQVMALLSNIRANQLGTSPSGIDSPTKTPFRSGYAPAYKNNKGEVQITDGILYAFSQEGKIINLFGSDDGIIPNISYNRSEKLKSFGFETPEDNGTGPKGNTGYDNRQVSDVGFTWTSNTERNVNSLANIVLAPGFEGLSGLIGYNDEIIGDKKSLLVKTQKLFNSKGMKNIVSTKGDMNNKSSQIQTANGNGISKGNAVMKEEMFDKDTGRYVGKEDATAAQTYCRSWTTLERYDRMTKLVRSGVDGIRNGIGGESDGVGINSNVPYRFNTQGSVLDGFGVPKIAPYSTDSPDDPKKFMFSIENLAWNDDIANLPNCEVGPGDLLTGKKGRIMWFPPYNINFSENSSINWEATNFIGRGESVYTYNNTERMGNLSFQIIVDHPSYINAFRGANGPDDSYVNSFWAGCIDPDGKWGEKLTVSEKSDIINENLTIPQKKTIPDSVGVEGLKVYFPNDNSEVNLSYENGLSGSSISEYIDYDISLQGEGYGLAGGSVADVTQKAINGKVLRWVDRYNFGLNYSFNSINTPSSPKNIDEIKGFFDPNTIPAIAKVLTETCKYCRVELTGFASIQGFGSTNVTLGEKRAKNVEKYLLEKLTPLLKGGGLTDEQIKKRFKVLGGKEDRNDYGCIKQTTANPDPATDPLGCKISRYVKIEIVKDSSLADEEISQPDPIIKQQIRRVNTKITNRFYTECNYFEQLTDADPFVFDKFRDKIKYFHPGFHSTTPEGLNSRLTFLLQCTKQGRTLEKQGANNLAFGRAPICILRIGDFYNTKIIMDSLSIDYEPLVWDLNPEGIGVQPMIANVTISFKFIGGSSLMGPINKLQNALSFNYFANTQVYDPRADYLSKNKPPTKAKKLEDTDSTKKEFESPLSPTGYYLNNIIDDLYKGDVNKFIDGGIETNEEIIDNTPNVDQEKLNEEVNSGEQTLTDNNVPVAVVETISITNFHYVSIQNTVGNKGYIFQLGVNTTGMYNRVGSVYNWIISDEEFKKWVSKGLKIRLLKSNILILEELALYDNSISTKKASNLVTSTFYLGQPTPQFGTGVISLAAGDDYTLECWYNGSKVCGMNIVVDPDNHFSYYN